MARRILLAGVGVTAGVAMVLLWTVFGGGGVPTPDPGEAALLPAPYTPSGLELETAGGRSWSLADEEGRMVALFFGYANCPDVCPLTLNRLGRVQEARSRAGDDAPPFRVVFVSVDPARDDPALLRRYVERLPGEIVAVTGADVRAQAFDFGVRVAERPLPAGGTDDSSYLVDHTARTFLVDPAGRVTATIPPMAEMDETEAIVDAAYRRWAREGR